MIPCYSDGAFDAEEESIEKLSVGETYCNRKVELVCGMILFLQSLSGHLIHKI